MENELIVKDFYSKNEYEVLNILESSKEGLKEDEAILRLKHYGPNALGKKKFRTLIIFLRQFKSPLIWILLVTSFISMLVGGGMTSSIIILLMVLLSSLLSFYNEYRSEKIVEDLNKRIAHKVIVMRNGKKTEPSRAQICRALFSISYWKAKRHQGS